MRCPKCGYISFDHIETCLKCNKDISGGVEVEGTTYHAVAPSFLRVPKKDDVETELQAEELGDDDFEFSDPDLDVLNDGDEELSFIDSDEDLVDSAVEEVVEEAEGIDFQLEADEEIDDEGFDFDFDDEETADSPVSEEESQPSFSVPEELADISDLAPPVRERETSAAFDNGMDLSLDDEMNLDESLDLDGLDLDLGLGVVDGKEDAGSLSLSLDDIELSEDDIGIDNGALDSMSMDLDLDLDGLDETEENGKEKSSGSLDGLSLSLD